MNDEETPKSAGAELARLARDFLGPAAQEAGGILGDHLRYYRWRSAQAILRRAKVHADAIGLPLKEVPAKFLIPFIEKCSLEDEGSPLSELWARLLANAATGFDWKYVKYSDLLSRIDAQDAEMLLAMFRTADQPGAFLPERFSGPSWSEEINPRRLENVLKQSQVPPEDWRARGRWTYIIHEDDVANFQALSLAGFDEGMRLLALQSLGLVYVHTGTYLHGATIKHTASGTF